MSEPTKILRVATILSALLTLFSAGAQTQSPSDDLSSLSVDDLMNVEVTSVARRGEKLSDTAAAVYVITQEQIRRSGALSVPELLRLAPGMNVARINGSAWAIGSRGFNARFANKILVLIDGRSVYSPVFGGVHWDALNVPLEDIERIEVIRGPGGSVWGANAVNGVINIITRHTIATQGGRASAGGGTAEHSFASTRYGGAIGANAYYRVFAKADDIGTSADELGRRSHDSSAFAHGGFRFDWSGGKGSAIHLAGEMYRGEGQDRTDLRSFDEPFAGRRDTEIDASGANLLLRWTATQSKTSETTLQVTYDDWDRRQTDVSGAGQILDVDFQHELSLGKRHSLVWGGGYRTSHLDTADPLKMIRFIPNRVTTHLFSAFGQDQIALGKNVRLTIGSKIQYDRGAGLQMQPTLRALWTPSERQSLWAAATDTVRTPSLLDTAGHINIYARPTQYGTTFLVLQGNPELEPEQARTFEIGYRAQPLSRVAFDLTAFQSDYARVARLRVGDAYVDDDQHVIVPLHLESALEGRGRGFEAAATFDATSRWRLAGSYSYSGDIAMRARQDDRLDVSSMQVPRHQAQIRSSLTLNAQWDLDHAVYYVGAVPAQSLPSYTRVDARLAWHPSRAWDISIVGQNLFDDRHREYNGSDSAASATTIQRRIYGSVTWHF